MRFEFEFSLELLFRSYYMIIITWLNNYLEILESKWQAIQSTVWKWTFAIDFGTVSKLNLQNMKLFTTSYQWKGLRIKRGLSNSHNVWTPVLSWENISGQSDFRTSIIRTGLFKFITRCFRTIILNEEAEHNDAKLSQFWYFLVSSTNFKQIFWNCRFM